MRPYPNEAGMVALSIGEALLLAVSDRDLETGHSIRGVLQAAVAARWNDAGTSEETETLWAVAVLIQTLHSGASSVQQPPD